jgi:hypothetical protein
VSKSTTGAYGDFPDYYYERGNQFGVYLSGKVPRESWDDRHEHAVDGGITVVAPAARGSRPPTVAERLAEIVRVALTNEGAKRVYAELAGAEEIPTTSNGDVKESLVRVLTTRLTPQQQRRILMRLEAGAAKAHARDIERKRRSSRRSRRRRPSTAPMNASTPRTASAGTQKCALCRKKVSKAQAKTCLADPLLMGHIYCIDHVAKVRGVLGGA